MTPHTIQMDIWQFTRVMVEAETHPNGKVLRDAYGDIWAEVDTTLSETAKSNMEQYAHMMMETQITLDNANRNILDCITEMAEDVIAKLNTALNTATDDTIQQDYAFEIQGLETLIDEING